MSLPLVYLMARLEHDREDLLAEATALVERIELQVASEAEPVVVGFRSNGAASVYFGADPAYHFNADRQLRRAFAVGLLYKAEQGRLVSLERERSEQATSLLRRELNEDAQADFLLTMRKRIEGLGVLLAAGQFTVVGQVPEGAAIIDRVKGELATLATAAVAAAARVG